MANPSSITITEAVANGSVNRPAVQTIDTDGTVNCPVAGKTDRLVFELNNAAAATVTVTVKAGFNPPSLLSRDLAVLLDATGGAGDEKILGPFESARFLKADGSIDVAFLATSGSPNVQIRAYRLPKQI